MCHQVNPVHLGCRTCLGRRACLTRLGYRARLTRLGRWARLTIWVVGPARSVCVVRSVLSVWIA